MPAIVMTMFISTTPQAERSMIQCMCIDTCIVAIDVMYAIVSTNVSMIVHGYTEVEIVVVRILCIDTHSPSIAYHIDGAVEIVPIDKSTVLTTAKHIHKVFVAHIEQIIVVVYCIVISIYNIIDNLIHLKEEVKINFIYIFVLTIVQSELISHTVGKETCFSTNLRQAH